MKEETGQANPFDLMMNQINSMVEAKTKPLVDQIAELKQEISLLRQPLAKPIPMPDSKEYYNSEELCGLLGIHSNTLYRLRKDGVIKSIVLPGTSTYRYHKDHVKAYIEGLTDNKFEKVNFAQRPENAPKVGHKVSCGGDAQIAPPRTSYKPIRNKQKIA